MRHANPAGGAGNIAGRLPSRLYRSWRSFNSSVLPQRANEVRRNGVRWSNIDLARSEIRFVTTKTGRRMIIPLSDGLRAHIASLAPSDDPEAVLHPQGVCHLGTESDKRLANPNCCPGQS